MLNLLVVVINVLLDVLIVLFIVVLLVVDFVVEVFETFVTRQNLIGGKEFQERYDTPYFCSPASESYWSM